MSTPFAIMYPDETIYYPPKITKRHLKECKDGVYVIFDLENDRDCIKGEWINNKTVIHDS